MILYYQLCLVLSLILACVFVARWSRYVSFYFSMFYLLTPFTNICHYLLAKSTSIEAAVLANGMVYMLSYSIQVFFFLYVASFCKIKLSKIVCFIVFIISATGLFMVTLTDKGLPFMYKDVSLITVGSVSYIKKTYGIAHTLYYALLFTFILIDFGLLFFSMRKKDISRKNITLLLISYAVVVVAFITGRSISQAIDIMPLAYVIIEVLMLFVIKRLALYDVELMVSNAFKKEDLIGLAAFDERRNYLGCNKRVVECFPEFGTLRVDSPMESTSKIFAQLNGLMDVVENKQMFKAAIIKNGDIFYKVTAGFLYSDKKKIGYQLRIEDNTKEQEYIRLMNNYSADLEREVIRKTTHSQEIMNKLVLGMAEMVQSRDPNTGGHVKRTSQVVEILVSEMRKDKSLALENSFYENLIKAAPMHDLGKIAVDDKILRKPEKYVPEEYEIMKSHAEKGATIVESILTGIDDPELTKIAINVAYYHHERFDGSGYPKHLHGEEIPLEARIMAIADVYDALVSERCYKDPYSPEMAFNIMEDGMGTQFDPALNKYFIQARKKIESYYEQIRRRERRTPGIL